MFTVGLLALVGLSLWIVHLQHLETLRWAQLKNVPTVSQEGN